MKALVTGAAGSIGMHVSKALLKRGDQVIGINNLNDYYEVKLKLNRLKLIEGYDGFVFIKMDMADRNATKRLFEEHKFDRVFSLAAQAVVHYSLQNPHAYVDSILVGFVNIFDSCRHTNI